MWKSTLGLQDTILGLIRLIECNAFCHIMSRDKNALRKALKFIEKEKTGLHKKSVEDASKGESEKINLQVESC